MLWRFARRPRRLAHGGGSAGASAGSTGSSRGSRGAGASAGGTSPQARTTRARARRGDTLDRQPDPPAPAVRCRGAQAVALPAGTPSLRLLADQTAELLAGISRAQWAGIADSRFRPAGSASRRASPSHRRLAPSLVNFGRAFVVIGAAELFWVATALPDGANAITFAAIIVILRAPRADPANAVDVTGVAVGYFEAVDLCRPITIAADTAIDRKCVFLFQFMQQYAGSTQRLEDLRRRCGTAKLCRSRATGKSLAGFGHPGGRGPRGASAYPPFQPRRRRAARLGRELHGVMPWWSMAACPPAN
jgi:hypothetical protein